MYYPRNPLYQSTKRLKQGRKRLRPPFDELAAWLSKTRKVNVLNVAYYRRTKHGVPWLHVVHEHPTNKFERSLSSPDRRQKKSIVRRFIRIVESNDAYDFDVEGLAVMFHAFSPIALAEADEQVSPRQIAAMKKRIGPELWHIQHAFGQVVFFFYTDKQVKKHKAAGKEKICADLYFDVLKPYDEFGYLKRNKCRVRFDSKENFDNNYQGNWYYYYK